MKKTIIQSAVLLLAGTVLNAAEMPKEKYGMFPQPEEGAVRYIVDVPKTPNDADRRVELLIGKEMMVDCNHHSFVGKVEKLPLKGWGYSYYKISDIRSGPTTRMACREPKKRTFVSLHLPPQMQLMRYNSRLGSVVYVPEGFEVRYRIWRADDEVKAAELR